MKMGGVYMYEDIKIEGKAVCFTGHRTLCHEPRIIKDVLREQVALLVNAGYQNFLNGGAAGFDLLAAEVVVERKKLCHDVSLYLYVPYSSVFTGWTDAAKRLRAVSLEARNVHITSPRPYKHTPLERDREMVAKSDLCVSYLRPDTTRGGTLYTVNQARKKGIEVIDLYDVIDTWRY